MQSRADIFDWLDDPRQRRSALRDIAAAVRRGWLTADDTPDLTDRRTALIERLTPLLDAPDVGPWERLAVLRIFALMGVSDVGDHT